MGHWTDRLSPQARRLLQAPETRAEPSPGRVLSRAQRRFAYLEQLHPGLYNSGRLWEVPSDLNLQGPLDQLMARHAILRTTLSGEVLEARPGLVTLENIALAEASQMDQHIQDRLAIPFRGLLLQGALYQLPQQRYLLLKTHHAISDFSSRMALGRELAQLCAGQVLPPPEWSYADFARQEDQWLQSTEAQHQREFWQQHLAGAVRLDFGQRTHLGGARLRRTLNETPNQRFSFRLAALFLLLWNRTACRDLCVGVPVSLRTRPERIGLPGCLINTVLVRIRLVPEEPFEQFLVRVEESLMASLARCDLPFEEAQPPNTPLCSVMLNQLPEGEPSGWPTRRCDRPLAFHELSFTFSAQELELEYADQLFAPVTAEKLLELYLNLLPMAAQQPQSSLACLADRLTGTALTRIEQQVLRSPQAPAVRGLAGERSYAQLWQRAEQLARRLHLPPGRPVALRMGRCLQLPECIVGVWRAGGSVLLLDPSLPELRIQAMCQAARPALQLLARGQTPLDGIPVHWLEEEAPLQDLPPAPPGSQSAYLMFTSGSSGRPKSVSLSHANLAHFLEGIDRLEWGPLHTVMTTALSFDIAWLEIIGPLVSGGSCYASELDGPFEAGRLAQVIATSRCNLLQLTPSVWRLLLRSGWRPHPGLTLGLSGGERLDDEVHHFLVQHFERSWNLYGPTEATIWISAQSIGPDNTASLGQPFPGACLRVDGEELVLAGPQLASGYGNADSASFFRGPAWEPCYRTGDRVARQADGSLHFLGRLDGQLKIRGTRVEPGEIEAILRQECQGDQVAVMADPRGDALVAFVIGPRRDLSGLRQRLSGAALPAEVRFLEQAPLNSSGKLDRASLLAQLSQSTPAAVAADDLEERLLGLWRRQLARPGLQAEDDFFEHGGHSLAAAELLLAVHQDLGIRPPLGHLLRHASARSFAQHLRAQGDAPWPSLVSFQKGPVRAGQVPFFCFHPTGASVLIYRKLAALLPEEVVFCGLDPLPDDLDIAQKGEQYAQEIRRFWPHGPYFLGGLSSGGTLAYATAHELQKTGGAVKMVALLDTILPGQFARRPRTRLDRLRAWCFHLANLLFLSRGKERLEYLRELISRLHRAAPPPLPPRSQSRGYQAPTGDFPVVLFRASHRNSGGADPASGWRPVARNLRIETIRGFHGTDLIELTPLVKRLATQLTRALRQAREASPDAATATAVDPP